LIKGAAPPLVFFTFPPQLKRELLFAEGLSRRCLQRRIEEIYTMRIRFAAAAAVLALGLAGTALAQPQYSSDYSNAGDGFAPTKMAPPKPAHYTHHKAPEYSDDYTSDSDGFAPVHMAPRVDKMSTASIKPLPDCSYMSRTAGVHTQGGDSGASHTDACRDIGNK
jgi:hypothetical protein